jgi:glycosyltransferase involved in cell wall biosynthesis
MPVYNALPYLKEAVDSLLTQTFADIEILALDDESTDGSGEFLESIDDPRMRVFRCEKQGVVRLRNKGLNLARGQYYVVMDADDVSAPLRIERQVAFMDRNPEIVACGSQGITTDGGGHELGPRECPLSHAAIFAELATCGSPMIAPATIIRVQALLAVGGYDSGLETSEDFDLWWRLCSRGRLANHSDVLLKYRWHGANESIVKRGAQLRDSRKIMIDHLLANGIASSADEGDAYVSFFARDAPNITAISKREITAFSAVSKRLLGFVASSPFFSGEDVGQVRRHLRWAVIAKALRCSRLSTNRYKLLLLSSRLFPEEGRFRNVLWRRLRNLYTRGRAVCHATHRPSGRADA